MALTVGTQRLGLQNIEATSSKNVVLVKLTDSALGAIAQFLRQRVGNHFHNYVTFDQNFLLAILKCGRVYNLDKVI